MSEVIKGATLSSVGDSLNQQPQPAAEPTAAEVLVRDPLTPVTRKERLYLLAVSMIGIAMVRTGLVPSKIATFGIELNQPNRSALLFLLALVTIYFFGAFIIYSAADYEARRVALRAARLREELRKEKQWEQQWEESGIASEQSRPYVDLEDTGFRSGMIALTRLLFEFLLPLLVGGFAIYSLLARALT